MTTLCCIVLRLECTFWVTNKFFELLSAFFKSMALHSKLTQLLHGRLYLDITLVIPGHVISTSS